VGCTVRTGDLHQPRKFKSPRGRASHKVRRPRWSERSLWVARPGAMRLTRNRWHLPPPSRHWIFTTKARRTRRTTGGKTGCN